jgi:large subunit ribosomal protein L10
MARPHKAAVVDEVRERMQAAPATVLTEYRGLTVADLARLRAELRKSGAEYKVVKNTLTRIAARDAGIDIPDDTLTGPTAVAFCGDDLVAAAKALRAFSRERPSLVVKGGVLEGRYIGAEETLKLADLKSRDELLAQLAGLMEAVVAQPARLALASLSKMARLLAAFAEKREGGWEPAGTAAAAPADAAPADAAAPDEASGADEAQVPDEAADLAGRTGEPNANAEQPLSSAAAESEDAPATETEPAADPQAAAEITDPNA